MAKMNRKLTAVLGSEISSSISSSLLSLGLEVERSSCSELVIMVDGGGDGDGGFSFCGTDPIKMDVSVAI